ncbi:MAG: cohesin domain-containing protein [Candidatus Levybacteria bacterium]|nr:cohesin domain-containing protein [Candidatus Levybacteria bacterium]
MDGNNNMIGFFEKISALFKTHKKHFVMAGIAVLALSIPIIISQVLKSQDNRQRAAAGDPVTLSFSPSSGQKSIGDEFDVTLNINTNTNDVSAIDGYLKYYDNILQLQSVTPGSPYTKVDIAPISYGENDGNIHVGVQRIILYNDTQQAVTGDTKTLVTLRFKALANGAGPIGFGADPRDSAKSLKISASGFSGNVPVTNTSLPLMANFTVGTVTGDPPPADGKTPLSLKTDYVNLTADDFAIKVNGTAFKTPATFTKTASDPGADKGLYTTLEAEWKQDTIEMRMNMDFKYDGTVWYVVELRTYDGKTPGEWIYYATTNSQGNIVQHALTQTFINAGVTTFKPKVGTADNSISFENLHLQAFLKSGTRPSPTITTAISPSPAPTTVPVNVCTASKYRAEDCVCTEATQCRSGVCTGGKCAKSPKDTVPEGSTGLKLSIKIPLIGERTATVDNNPLPKNSSRIVSVDIKDRNNAPVAVDSSNNARKVSLHFDGTNYNFEGQINLGTTLETGDYLVKLSTDNSLYKLLPGIITITKGRVDNPTATIKLVTGDLNQDNKLSISDWTNMIACNENKPACTADIKALADLNDNGEIDALDVTMLQIGFGTRNGD